MRTYSGSRASDFALLLCNDDFVNKSVSWLTVGPEAPLFRNCHSEVWKRVSRASLVFVSMAHDSFLLVQSSGSTPVWTYHSLCDMLELMKERLGGPLAFGEYEDLSFPVVLSSAKGKTDDEIAMFKEAAFFARKTSKHHEEWWDSFQD